MRHLSYRLALLIVVCTVCSSATPHKAKAHHSSSYYYWYTYPADTFVEWNSVSQEITLIENELGVIVNTTPVGGTLEEVGYIDDNEPHDVAPSVYLYAHY